jgi:hypothetical protein
MQFKATITLHSVAYDTLLSLREMTALNVYNLYKIQNQYHDDTPTLFDPSVKFMSLYIIML